MSCFFFSVYRQLSRLQWATSMGNTNSRIPTSSPMLILMKREEGKASLMGCSTHFLTSPSKNCLGLLQPSISWEDDAVSRVVVAERRRKVSRSPRQRPLHASAVMHGNTILLSSSHCLLLMASFSRERNGYLIHLKVWERRML